MKWLKMLVFCVLLVIPTLVFGCSKSFKMSAPRQDDANSAVEEKRKEPLSEDSAKQAAIERKIIYNADIQITVADFGKAEQDLLQIVEANKAYAAQAEVTGSVGKTRQGLWRVRVPLSKLDAFREETKKLGDLVRYASDAKDVTEEYFDLQVRIKNKEAELD